MIEPQVPDTIANPVTGHPEPGEIPAAPTPPVQSRRPRVVPRPSPLFPVHAAQQSRPRLRWTQRVHELALEAVTERKNQIPLGLLILLSIAAIVLMGAEPHAKPTAPPLQEFLTHFTVSSSQPETSLFGNDRYLGEIGPVGRRFALLPGIIRLRVIHSHCRASDTTIDFKAGEDRTIGPLNAACGF